MQHDIRPVLPLAILLPGAITTTTARRRRAESHQYPVRNGTAKSRLPDR